MTRALYLIAAFLLGTAAMPTSAVACGPGAGPPQPGQVMLLCGPRPVYAFARARLVVVSVAEIVGAAPPANVQRPRLCQVEARVVGIERHAGPRPAERVSAMARCGVRDRGTTELQAGRTILADVTRSAEDAPLWLGRIEGSSHR